METGLLLARHWLPRAASLQAEKSRTAALARVRAGCYARCVMKRFLLIPAILLAAHTAVLAADAGAPVKLLRTPGGGLQPQTLVDAKGALHLVSLAGGPGTWDVFYARRDAGGTNFSAPLRVNSQPGTATAVGTIRGAQLALGRDGRVHVAWNGAGGGKSERGAPMLYARMNDARDAFEPQRDVSTSTMHLDGGGSVAADDAGNVYVLWHAASVEGPKGEQNRAVFMAKSTDDGKTFATEKKVNPKDTGACGCCGLKAFADARGQLSVLYRSAAGGLDRSATLLLSTDHGKTFRSASLDSWRIATCPMSSMTLAQGRGDTLLAAWETQGQIFHAPITPATLEFPDPQKPDGDTPGRKHPVLATSDVKGRRQLLAWTEGTGWKKGGALAWELTDLDTGLKTTGRAPGVPVWGRVAAVAEADGTFTIFY